VTAIGVVLGAFGPFGSYLNDAFPVRTAYWIVSLWTGWLTVGRGMLLLSRLARARSLPVWLWTPPAVVILAFLPAAFSRLLALKLWPVVERVGWLEWYAQSLLISALAAAAVVWRARGRDRKPNLTAADPRERLPPRLGRDVLCLKIEDHYVRVHTTKGSALILMTLSQAIEGLKDLEGAQIHRSWWVARSAITGVVEDGRNLRLRLSAGIEAPVSRARVASLRELGWLASSRGGLG